MNASDYMSDAQQLLGDLPKEYVGVLTLLIGLSIGGFRLYQIQKRGEEIGAPGVIAVLPWDVIKHAFQQIRHARFTVDATGGGIRVNEDIDGIRRLLAERHFGPWNKLSYVYEGEDLNMRRMERMTENGSRTWWQLHVRAFDEGEYVRLKAHVEKCPIEHPQDHIEEVGYDEMSGYSLLRELLDDADVEIVADQEGS